MTRVRAMQSVMREALLGLALAGLPAMAVADERLDVSLDIEEWTVPYADSRPRDPWVGRDRIWFVGQRGHYVGAFTPSSSEFKRYDLPRGTGPHNVIANEAGVWYAGNRAAHIGLLEPRSGEIRRFTPPGDGRRDVHTMVFDDEGDIWFTEQGGNRVGHFDTGEKAFTMYDVPTPGARPYGIVMGDGQPWIALFGTHKLATIEDGEFREIELSRENARPRRLAVTDAGDVWYGDYAGSRIGRYEPDTGEVTEWEAPAGADSRPYAVALDGDGRFWVVETGVRPNRFVAFDTRTERWSRPFDVPSGGGTVRNMDYDSQADAIWFGTDANTIGRAAIE